MVRIPVVIGIGLPAVRRPAAAAAAAAVAVAVAGPSASLACPASTSAPERLGDAAGCKHAQLPRSAAGHSKNWGWSANWNRGPASAVVNALLRWWKAFACHVGL